MSDAASAIENIVIYQMKLYVFLKQETIALDAAVNEPEPYEVCFLILKNKNAFWQYRTIGVWYE